MGINLLYVRFCAFVLLLLTNSVIGQPLLNRFKSFDITYTSGEVLNLTTVELKRLHLNDYNSLLELQQRKFYTGHNIMYSLQRFRFMQDFKISLEKTRSSYIKKEVLFSVNPKVVEEVCIEPLRRSTNFSSSKYIDNLIVPAFRAGFSDYFLERSEYKYSLFSKREVVWIACYTIL